MEYFIIGGIGVGKTMLVKKTAMQFPGRVIYINYGDESKGLENFAVVSSVKEAKKIPQTQNIYLITKNKSSQKEVFQYIENQISDKNTLIIVDEAPNIMLEYMNDLHKLATLQGTNLLLVFQSINQVYLSCKEK